MANVSAVTPAQTIATSRTAASAAASSTASPNFNQNITTWTLPGQAAQPLWRTTQGYSTKQGEVFTDFASGNLQGGTHRSLQSGNPTICE